MMTPGSLLWQYLSPQQRALAGDGEFLVADSLHHKDKEPTDFSYLVFPYAKMYEGFLKQLFLDLNFISEHDYYSNHFRIGKVLSPHIAQRLGGRSVYLLVENKYGKELAARLWDTWKEGRNLVFHYFPHNFRALTRVQSVGIIQLIIATMEETVRITHVRPGFHGPDICLVGKSRFKRDVSE
jgi:hypothetical protein